MIMTKKDVNELLTNIDNTYNTKYSINDGVLDDWFRDFKKYDKEDIFKELERYKKNNYTYAPKKWQILNNCKTAEQKQKEREVKIQCPFCKRYINGEEYDKHYGRCLDLNYLDRLCYKALRYHFDKESMYYLDDFTFKNKFDNTIIKYKDYITNKQEIICLNNYFKGE